ncbi:MAG: NADPH-dependent 7-cyano-7-deazaguanine reductase QueF [Candidatus Omnitrophica bacterium]|jgi:7-cyano-7-deazaguanine reductase|nr:NADPH-dependent 7-cyano-7-deazaguanine reductase QueF [Candidatus Omnitrophota bacterium]
MIYEERLPSPIEKKAKKIIGKTFSSQDIDNSILQTIDYEYPKCKITVELKSDEFTCLCPFSGLPDFALLTIQYIPRRKLIELKSLKYYLYSFRNVKIYNEHAVNKILQDLNKALKPYKIIVTGEFTSRGGIKNKVCAQHNAQK